MLETIVINLSNTELSHRDKIQNILSHKSISHRTKVEFAYYCASDLEQYYDAKKNPEIYKKRQKCLDLVKQWLINPELVSQEELRDAIAAVNTAAYVTADPAAAYTAYAAAAAADSAAYAAANSAADSGYTSAYAAYGAYVATIAADYTVDAYTARSSVERQQWLYLFKLLKLDKNLIYLAIIIE